MMMQRVHVRGLRMELGAFSAVLAVLTGLRNAAGLSGVSVSVSNLGAGEAPKAKGMVVARSRSVAACDCAVKAAAMAMAPLMPVPATRQMTVL